MQVGPHLPKTAFCNLLKDNEVLQQLALQNCSDWLTDKELLPVIGQNHHLQQIQLSSCLQLSRHALVAISLSCPHVRGLSLAHCEWVDSLSLRSLADHCKGLESLDLTACRQLKDEAICYLAQKCSRLKSLSLAVNANVGDTAVEEIAKCCPELEHLDLTGCLRVKNESIRYQVCLTVHAGWGPSTWGRGEIREKEGRLGLFFARSCGAGCSGSSGLLGRLLGGTGGQRRY